MIAALVPAAGSSTRLGQPKLLVKLDGQTLIGRVVSALRDGGARRVVVVAPPADAPEGPAVADHAHRAGAEVVVPATRPAEMRDSIELGLTALAGGDRPRCVLLTPGDHPGITPQLVGQIIACAIQIPDRIVIPCVSGQRGHPIALPWAIATLIHSLPRGAGVNAVVAAHAQTISELVLSDPQILADLDTPEDLALYQDRLALFRLPVRLFALAKDRAGCPEVEVELRPGSTVADLRAALVARVPAIGPLVATALIAVDDEYAGDHVPVRPGSRLAVIPPVSGGTAPASRCRHPSGRGTRRP